MSRSIHTTHGDLSREKRCSYSSKELHRQRLRELASAIGKKQRIKLHSRQDRRKRRTADVRPLATDDPGVAKPTPPAAGDDATNRG